MEIKIIERTKELEDLLKLERYPIEITDKKGTLRLLGFNKHLNRKEEVVMAFKLNHSERKIILYKKANPSDYEKRKINKLRDYLKNRYIGYRFIELQNCKV